MMFPYASTPVTEAARSNNFPMVRWLIEQGADITIADKYGDRPYTVAVQNKNQELADYLSVDRSAMCAELSRMKRDGLIDYNRNQFEIVRRSAL